MQAVSAESEKNEDLDKLVEAQTIKIIEQYCLSRKIKILNAL